MPHPLHTLACLTGIAAPALEPGENVPRVVAPEPWPAERGSHRAIVRVDAPGGAAGCRIPWRRRDRDAEAKGILVLPRGVDTPVRNVLRRHVSRELGELAFEPTAGPGEYEVYYLPCSPDASTVDTATRYLPPEPAPEDAWLAATGLTLGAGELPAGLPRGEVLRIEARRELDLCDPMEVVASEREVAALLAAHPAEPLVVFPESREFAIRMDRDIPLRWVESGARRGFEGEALRDEYFTFQVGLYAPRQAVEGVSVRFRDLRGARGAVPASAWRCINLGGADWCGRIFEKRVDVPEGGVQALWVGALIPADLPPGDYAGEFLIGAEGLDEVAVPVRVRVLAEVAVEHGDTNPAKHTRLRWLDSTLGAGEGLVAPYTALELRERTIRCLGRVVRFGPDGLLESIRSYFADTLDEFEPAGREMLAGPMRLLVEAPGGVGEWRIEAPARVTHQSEGAIEWRSRLAAGDWRLELHARMEFDGSLSYALTMRSERRTEVRDIRLEVPLRRSVARYQMGLGREGGLRPERWDWTWDPDKHQDAVWLGDVNAGLRVRLRGENYRRPLVNIYYRLKPLAMPESWCNEGRGGCAIEPAGADTVMLRAFSGPRSVEAGKSLQFDLDLLVTPLKLLDGRHWGERYYHAYEPIAEIAQTGATVVNIHHANELNPYINYPFLRLERLAPYVDEAHAAGLKLKIYYTVRELTNHLPELWALRSLGHEVLADGPGMGDVWLTEHLEHGFKGAWRADLPDGDVDAAILTSGMSRWHNYYVEGLAYLLRHAGIDGLYIDDVAYDREVMKRVRRVLDAHKPGCLVDLHSWNHFNDWARFASCANLYMEHFAYLDSLWFGEGFDYGRQPDYWLVEMSGIPYGLFSEMLQGPVNLWRGMLFGMTPRLPWSGDPRPLWGLWDDFGIAGAKMRGWWSEACPVRTDREDVLATAYVREGRTLVCVASWAPESISCGLTIDCEALGLDPRSVTIEAPGMAGMQAARPLATEERLQLEPGGGAVLIVRGEA